MFLPLLENYHKDGPYIGKSALVFDFLTEGGLPS